MPSPGHHLTAGNGKQEEGAVQKWKFWSLKPKKSHQNKSGHYKHPAASSMLLLQSLLWLETGKAGNYPVLLLTINCFATGSGCSLRGEPVFLGVNLPSKATQANGKAGWESRHAGDNELCLQWQPGNRAGSSRWPQVAPGGPRWPQVSHQPCGKGAGPGSSGST